MKMRFILALLALTAVLIACGSDEPPTPATVAELCTLAPNTIVQVEGNLNLPLSLLCQEGRCSINFGKDDSGILAKVRASDDPANNMMQLPPENYSLEDLTLVLADGTTLTGSNAAVVLTGQVKQPSANSCYLNVHSLNRP